MLFDADILHHVTLTTQGGGIMQNTADILQITSTIVADNIVQSPSGGANFYVSYGGRTASLLLPAPPGYWLPAVECTIQRDACHYNDKACRIAEARCSLDGSDNVDRCNPSSTSDCALVSERQSCDWRTSPQDLGKTAYVLTQGHYDQAYPFPCAAGLLGGSGSLASEQTTALCAGLCPAGFTCGTEATVVPAVCPPGHYCPAGSTVPLPCPAGRFNSANGSQSMEECTPTDPGFYTSAGSTEQMACRAGTAAPIAGMGACNRCTPGTFQAKAGQVACVACEPGSYCAEGAAAALPCAEGSYSSSTSLTSAMECALTDQGHYAPAGSTQQTLCGPGTFAPNVSMGACVKCAAGTFQDEEGKLTCKPCTAGSYCAEGAAAALPCEGGSYSSSTSLTRAAECTLTDQGYYASTGSTQQTPCAAGTAQASSGMGSCSKCAAGTFQDEEGKLTCKPCTAGSYCAEGAAAALPCEGGSYSSSTSLTRTEECTLTDQGHYASTGSTQQTLCSPGTFAPNVSMGACVKCAAGTFQDEEGKLTCKPCTAGSYCAEGAAAALPCNEGSYSSSTSLTSAEECTLTDQGYYAPAGSTQQKLCSPGTFAPTRSMGACDKCAAGTFQDEEGKLTCKLCTAGSYCAEGAAAALPCKEGSYSSSTNFTSAEECELTDQGHYASTGSTQQTPCAAGTFAPNVSMGACVKCAVGTFQDEEGKLTCKPCTAGSYCAEGAAAALPCKAGSYSSSTNLTSAEECTLTDQGHYASTGSTGQTACNPGTYANEPGMPTCTSCEPGRYQPNFKSTRCVLCAVASYCPGFRTTSPTPCPGGTFSNITGLSADWQCTPVEPGFWAPTGSTFPEECPTSGFTCPGRAQDKVNDPPGSKPLLVNSGQASINIKEDIIIFSLALNASLNEYDEDAAIAELATHYKVDASLISVEATPMSYGRRLASNDIMKPDGNLLLRITILVPKASKGKLAAPETLSSRLAELDTPVLFGSSTVLSQNMTISTLSRQESVECPVGYCEACAHQIPTPIKPLPEP